MPRISRTKGANGRPKVHCGRRARLRRSRGNSRNVPQTGHSAYAVSPHLRPKRAASRRPPCVNAVDESRGPLRSLRRRAGCCRVLEFHAWGALRSGLRSFRIISADLEVVHALDRFEDVGAGFEGVHQACDRALGDFAQEGFEFEWAFSMGFMSGL